MRPAVERKREAASRSILADIARQHRTAGHLGQQNMEFGREPDRQRLVVAARPLLLVDMGIELLDLLRRQPARQAAHDQRLKSQADVEDVARLVPARRRDRGAVVAPQLDQPFGGELAQDMPHDGAARAKAFANRVFRQLGARPKRLLDDGVPQRAIDGAASVRPAFRVSLGGCWQGQISTCCRTSAVRQPPCQFNWRLGDRDVPGDANASSMGSGFALLQEMKCKHAAPVPGFHDLLANQAHRCADLPLSDGLREHAVETSAMRTVEWLAVFVPR